MAKPQIVVVDIETTGLIPGHDTMLELAIVILDVNLNEIATFSEAITDDHAVQWLDHLQHLAMQEPKPENRGKEPFKGARIVHEMHQDSGLAMEIRQRNAAGDKRTLFDVETAAHAFLGGHYVDRDHNWLPMTGSSILLDRSFIKAQMPTLDSMFHYRNTDISSLKNIVSVYLPHIYDEIMASYPGQKTHRGLDDCRDSIHELREYLTRVIVADTAPVTA